MEPECKAAWRSFSLLPAPAVDAGLENVCKRAACQTRRHAFQGDLPLAGNEFLGGDRRIAFAVAVQQQRGQVRTGRRPSRQQCLCRYSTELGLWRVQLAAGAELGPGRPSPRGWPRCWWKLRHAGTCGSTGGPRPAIRRICWAAVCCVHADAIWCCQANPINYTATLGPRHRVALARSGAGRPRWPRRISHRRRRRRAFPRQYPHGSGAGGLVASMNACAARGLVTSGGP